MLDATSSVFVGCIYIYTEDTFASPSGQRRLLQVIQYTAQTTRQTNPRRAAPGVLHQGINSVVASYASCLPAATWAAEIQTFALGEHSSTLSCEWTIRRMQLSNPICLSHLCCTAPNCSLACCAVWQGQKPYSTLSQHCHPHWYSVTAVHATLPTLPSTQHQQLLPCKHTHAAAAS